MTTTREYPAERHDEERRAGLLICRCAEPWLQPLPMWGVTQCGRCGYKVLS